MLLNRLAQPFQHILRTQRSVGPQHMALPGMLVEDGQHPQRSSAHRGIGDEVPGPDMPTVRSFGWQPRPRLHDARSSACSRAHAARPLGAVVGSAASPPPSLPTAVRRRSAGSRSAGAPRTARPSVAPVAPGAARALDFYTNTSLVQAQGTGTPFAQSTSWPPPSPAPVLYAALGLPFFFADRLQHSVLE